MQPCLEESTKHFEIGEGHGKRKTLTNAVLTLGRSMFSLIANETCFTMKSVHIRRHCANHDRNMFSLIMIETISQVILI